MMKTALGIMGLIFACTATLFAEAHGPYIAVLSENDREIILELTAPAFTVEEEGHGGVLYQKLSLPGFGLTREVGKPKTPVRGTLIGIPETGGITLEVLDAPYEVLDDYRLYPAPRRVVRYPTSGVIEEEFVVDPESYQTDAFSPQTIVKQGFSGYMRDQRVVQLLFYPVQFNPVSNEIRVYRTIRVRVSFDQEDVHALGATTRSARKGGGNLPVYEEFLKKTLINDPNLNRRE